MILRNPQPLGRQTSVVINRQKRTRTAVNLRAIREFSKRLSRELSACGLMSGHFDVTLIDDVRMAKLNQKFRGKPVSTDVLSFPCQDEANARDGENPAVREMAGFLGDIVIATETARRNAATEEHSLQTEIQQLILHGALHLLGYDHETDHGEMVALELRLRRKLGVGGKQKAESGRQKAEGRKQKARGMSQAETVE